jgi:transposase
LFLRKNAVYTERVREKAVLSVYEDGMPFRRATRRLARDFWVKPSEAMIRRWCREYAEGLDFCGDYQEWVVEEFSGVLCVDEIYQNKLALLVAVDPAAPGGGDRLVGYELIHGGVKRGDVEDFLGRLKRAGIEPDEVITDGSPLYPGALKEIWPTAAHQLCLFHETRLLTGEIYKAMAALRKGIPKPPASFPCRKLLGRPRKHPLPEQLAIHRRAIVTVLALHKQGVSIRAISKETGHSRNTIKRWLRGEIPKGIADGQLPTDWMLAETFAEEKPGEPGRTSPLTTTPEVPPPYSSWEQAREVRNLLWECRYLVLRRPDHLVEKEREKLHSLLESPIGAEVGLLRSFLEEWYALFYDERGERRTLPEAKERCERLKNDPRYRRLKHLRHLQARLDEEHFLKISRFLEQDQWEATNNGAERMGRAFRHLQKPRYNFRKPESIRRVIEVQACISKEEKLGKEEVPPGHCARGRKARRCRSGAPVAV